MQHEKQSDLESDFTFVLQRKLPFKKKKDLKFSAVRVQGHHFTAVGKH